MSNLTGVSLYSADNVAAAATGSSVSFDANTPYAHCQIGITAEGGTDAVIKVEIQGRLNSASNWVTLDKIDNSTEASVTQVAGAAVDVIFPIQLMPFMRAKISAAGDEFGDETCDVDVWILASSTQATRADS